MAEKKMSVQDLADRRDRLRTELREVEYEIASRAGEEPLPAPEPEPAPTKKK